MLENEIVDIIGNMTVVVDLFIGNGISLAILVVRLIVMAVQGKKILIKKGRSLPFLF